MTETLMADNSAHSPITLALIKAVRENHPQVASKCIKKGANVNVKIENGDSLLHICLDEVMGSILINGGGNVNAINDLKETPLHTSMHRGLKPLTLLLISSHTNVNAQDLNGTTPLHLAQATQINDTLLANKANPNLQNNVGDTPLNVAISTKGSPIVTALLNSGADKLIKNNAGLDAYGELNLLIYYTNLELSKVEKAIWGDVAATVLQDTISAESNIATAILEKTSPAGSFPALNLAKRSMHNSMFTATDLTPQPSQSSRRMKI